MSKGPEAFRTISEVAGELDLPQHVLRFWETRFNQIKPLKRGGGRRYYRPDDVELLRGIRHLLYGEGYTIRGVQRILHEQGHRFVVSAGKGQVAVGAVAINGHSHSDARSNGHAVGMVDGALALKIEPEDLDAEDADERHEPTFDPREFRPMANCSNGANEDADDPLIGAVSVSLHDRLNGDEVHRLQTTLSELLELKRLLDQVR